MKRLIIAIDCDDVLTPATEACVRIYNTTYGTEVKLKDAHDGTNPAWNIDRATLLRRFVELQSSDEFASIPPFDEAVQACARLAKSHDLYLVTARHLEVEFVTLAMLEQYFPGVFIDVEHVGLDGSKGETCSRLSADVLVDDNLRHLDDAKKYGTQNVIWFGDYEWNRFDVPGRDIIHCLDWLSVEKEIERIARR